VKSSDKEAVFTYRQVKLPKKAASQSSSFKIVTFLYTLLEGEYYRNEETDDLVAVTDVTYIRTTPGKAVIGSCAYSLDESKLSEINESEKTLCGLSGFKYNETPRIKSWRIGENSMLADKIDSAFKSYTGKEIKMQSSVTPTNANIVPEINSKTEAIAITIGENKLNDLTGTLITYLLDSNE
jgi:hypothetical protein